MTFFKKLKMNFEHLQLFLRVAHTQNISLAGRELGLSAAVASSHIQKLEADLGVRLIHRTTRKASLTEEGMAFLPEAQQVIDAVDTAKSAVGIGKTSIQGRLRITAPASFGRMHITPYLPKFTQQYPDLEIDLRLSDSIVDVVDGGFDIAIRDAKLIDSSMSARKLAEDKRVIVASPEYLDRNGRPTDVEQLSTHQWVMLPGLDTIKFSDSQQSAVKVSPSYLLDNGEAVRDASMFGMGLTLTSLWCSYDYLRQQKLEIVLPEYPVISETDIWAVYPSSRQLARKVRVFIDYLVSIYGDSPPWQ